jgi:hypothetical protein
MSTVPPLNTRTESFSGSKRPALVPPPRHTKRARLWFALLLVSVCFEGLGRKYTTAVPSAVFYYAKDAVLLLGLAWFGVNPALLRRTAKRFGAFRPIIICAFAWTLIQMFNPSQPSIALAIVGFRAYWLWWLAPLVTASALHDPADRRAALTMIALVAIIVAGFAIAQFAAPVGAPINSYARYEGEEVLGVALVGTTGRARVSSTFSYLVGFTDFVIIVPTLLFAVGLAEAKRGVRWLTLVAAALALGTMPMSGSRAPLFLSGAALCIVAWRVGFLRTKTGRRVVLGAALATVGSLVCVPEAFEGVNDRFHGSDTTSRFQGVVELFPPFAISVNDYPPLGDGTGTQQNARALFGVQPHWDTESEVSRLLAELGVVGYLLVWLTKVGLALVLARIGRSLKARGQVAMAGGALAFAFFAFVGNSAFDHIWQALFFIGVGIFLAAVKEAEEAAGMARGALGEAPRASALPVGTP